MLLSLDTKKANRRDGISARMLIKINCSKYCLWSGRIPGAWKVSSVVPIPKGSDSTSVSNYRPISLLPVVSKMLEIPKA